LEIVMALASLVRRTERKEGENMLHKRSLPPR